MTSKDNELPEAPDLEAIEIEITIKDDVYTFEEYTFRQLLTQRELEMGDPHGHVRMVTELMMNSALRQYLARQRGTNNDVEG